MRISCNGITQIKIFCLTNNSNRDIIILERLREEIKGIKEEIKKGDK